MANRADRNAGTSDTEAELLFEYRDLSVPRTFRFVENRGRFWLAAYVAPATVILAACMLWRFSSWYAWHIDILTPGRIALAAIALSASLGIALGLTSILRGESKSYYAYQPLISAVLLLLFTLVWAVTIR